MDLHGCVCSRCKKWHSHNFKDKYGKYVCFNCKYKKNEVRVGDGKLC